MARVSAALLLCVSLAAIAGEPPANPKTPPATAKAKPDAEAPREFKPPPGFKPKKHGDVTLYCRKEAVLGSRFPAEKCYDEAGIHAIKLAELEQKEALERMRACGGSACSAN